MAQMKGTTVGYYSYKRRNNPCSMDASLCRTVRTCEHETPDNGQNWSTVFSCSCFII